MKSKKEKPLSKSVMLKIFAPTLNLKMTTALYKVVKYDDQHYEIIANSLGNMDSTFQSNLSTQWYIFAPEQYKYIMTKQGMPPSWLVTALDFEEKE